MNKKFLISLMFLTSMLIISNGNAFSQDLMKSDTGDTSINSTPPERPGFTDGNSTVFEIDDSDYLNVKLECSEPVQLMMESVQDIIILQFEPSESPAPVDFKLIGLNPLTTYYIYKDNEIYPDLIVTDENGVYSFSKNLTEPYIMFVQTRPSTIHIPYDQNAGTWDEGSRTYTLTGDVYGDVWIDQDNLTLDGNGYTISNGYFGIRMINRRNVTVKNLVISMNNYGVYLWRSYENVLTNNTITKNNYDGVNLGNSSNNKISNNVISENGKYGIYLYYSSFNDVSHNSIDNQVNENIGTGVMLFYSHNNNVMCNISENNKWGFLATRAHRNLFEGNEVSSSIDNGIYINYSNYNTITRNNSLGNMRGIHLMYSYYNQVYSNNFIDNKYQARIYSGGGNIFNLDLPSGGNHWSVWTSPDHDNDGFVDYPFQFVGGQDNLPWVNQFTWSAQAEASPQMATVDSIFNFDASASYDTNHGMTYEWDFGDGNTASGLQVSHTFDKPGVYEVTLKVRDDLCYESSDTVHVVAYVPEGGFVTGGGWIWSGAGNYVPEPNVSGWASFGFVAKYHKGAEAPDGQAELIYHDSGMNFHSTHYDWLVVTGGNTAKFKGKGTINGDGEYKFMIWASDGAPDKFRIKIWEETNGEELVVYDNSLGIPAYENGQPIGKGSIVIHDQGEEEITYQCTDGWTANHTDTFATYILEVDRSTLGGYATWVKTLNRVDQSLSVFVTSLYTGNTWSFTEPHCGESCSYLIGWYGGTGEPVGEGAGLYRIEISQDKKGEVGLRCVD